MSETSKLLKAKGYLKHYDDTAGWEEIPASIYTEAVGAKEDLLDAMSLLGPPGIDPYNLRQSQQKHQLNLTDLSTDIQRAQRTSAKNIAQTGVKAPSRFTSGPGYLTESQMDPFYTQGETLTEQKSDVYGLGETAEQGLLDWMDTIPTV